MYKGPFDHFMFYIGLSTDTKPTNAALGSRFFETDTRAWYIFDSSDWSIMPSKSSATMYAVTDPATNAAVATTIVNAYGGTVITLTGAGNTQTLQSPTIVTAGKIFTVVNDDTSTNNVSVVANSVTFTLTPGEGQCFLWDGSAWGPTDLGITDIPVKVTQGGTGQITASAALNALGVPSATAESDFIVSGSSPFAWVKKTLAQVQTLIKGDTDIADAISKKHTTGTDTALGTVGVKDPPIDADKAVYRDSTASDALVTSTWAQIKAFLKLYFDTLYNLYAHPNHTGDVTSVGDGAQTIVSIAGKYIYRADGTDVPVTDGGIGASTLTDHGILLGSGTDPVTALTPLAAGELLVGIGGADPHALVAGETTKILVGGGAADPVWTEATGTGAPVRQTSPALVTPALGTPASGEMSNCSDLSETENIIEHIQYPIPTVGYMLKAAADGSQAKGTNTDSDVADAVSKKHAQNTDTGTTATSFKINTGGNEADLQTTGLTADRDYTLPDIDTMLAGSVLMAQNIVEIIEYTP